MFCKNCGKPLNENAIFCGSCGTAVELKSSSGEIKETQNSPAATVDIPVMPEIPETPVSQPTKRKTASGSNSNPLIITLAVAVVTLIVVVVLLLFNREAGPVTKKGAELSIDSFPSETDSVSYVISGSVSSYDENAVLTVDGYEVIYLQAGDKNVSWSKEVWLSEGENTFEVELVPDDGERLTETVEIEYSPSLLYEAGTVLVKSDPAGIFIRPTPAITKDYILYLPYYDFDTRLVCHGVEYRDGEGFIWCKVQIPNGKIGWVRSDIVKRY